MPSREKYYVIRKTGST